MTETERAKQLANDHWDGYVSHMVEVHSVGANYTQAEVMAICKHHYISATIHGYKHAIEDERNGIFRPRISEPLTTGEIAAIARPCSNCYDEDACNGGSRLASGDCLHHRPKVADQQHPHKEG